MSAAARNDSPVRGATGPWGSVRGLEGRARVVRTAVEVVELVEPVLPPGFHGRANRLEVRVVRAAHGLPVVPVEQVHSRAHDVAQRRVELHTLAQHQKQPHPAHRVLQRAGVDQRPPASCTAADGCSRVN